MMTRLLLTTLLMCSMISSKAFSHGDHQHPSIEPLEAQQAAVRAAEYFSKNDAGLGFGKLKSSWGELSFDRSKVVKTGEGYFIVSVDNDDEKQTLFVLISDEGDIYDANFTGEFPKLNPKLKK